ncbi:MAG: hypothetical protein MZV70_19655 [Desulfobacterales bacterium]|nr:hypothetical protein [Desulfobacterales bacterium]
MPAASAAMATVATRRSPPAATARSRRETASPEATAAAVAMKAIGSGPRRTTRRTRRRTRAASARGLPLPPAGGEDGGDDRRQRQGRHPGDTARLLEANSQARSARPPVAPTAMMENAGTRAGNGDSRRYRKARVGSDTSGHSALSSKIEPPPARSSKCWKGMTLFYSGPDREAGRGERSVQERLSPITDCWRRPLAPGPSLRQHCRLGSSAGPIGTRNPRSPSRQTVSSSETTSHQQAT